METNTGYVSNIQISTSKMMEMLSNSSIVLEQLGTVFKNQPLRVGRITIGQDQQFLGGGCTSNDQQMTQTFSDLGISSENPDGFFSHFFVLMSDFLSHIGRWI